MMQDTLVQFLEALKGNPELLERLQDDSGPEEIAHTAKSLGFELTQDDIARYASTVTPKELDSVCGGMLDAYPELA